ncbi:hypothetical protein RIF29_08813 [Crotalaria pallida]|uniref:BTB domain-containing protein n=1 Tax=Crotalaria pallida TaxID=3830 RepID=A0AAN9IKF6_CROPI
MPCLFCSCDPCASGACKKCYEEAIATEEELRRNIEELVSKVNFLKLLSPVEPTTGINPSALFVKTDVRLLPSGDSSAEFVHAHKVILVNHSPVFKAMFANNNEERQNEPIKIEDVSYDALRAFVHYLYTIEACLDEQMAFDLLFVAEKFQVNHLKAYCEKFLIARLNPENAIANFKVAKQHNAKQLLDSSLEYIAKNKDELFKSEAYANLKCADPILIADIFEAGLLKGLFLLA